MPLQTSPHERQNAEMPNWFAAPATILTLCNPFLIGLTKSNGHAVQGFGTLFSEWQSFVGHRLEQDVMFVQRLARSRSPDEIAAAYADFWQQTTVEYAKEFVTMSKLLAGVNSKTFSFAQAASEEAVRSVLPSALAA
jgi:hypothetical protein